MPKSTLDVPSAWLLSLAFGAQGAALGICLSPLSLGSKWMPFAVAAVVMLPAMLWFRRRLGQFGVRQQSWQKAPVSLRKLTIVQMFIIFTMAILANLSIGSLVLFPAIWMGALTGLIVGAGAGFTMAKLWSMYLAEFADESWIDSL